MFHTFSFKIALHHEEFLSRSIVNPVKEDSKSRVQSWLDSYNPHEQSYSGLYVESDLDQFEPIYNVDVSWDSNINLVHDISNNFDNDQGFMHKSKLGYRCKNHDFIPVRNLEKTWDSKINFIPCENESRLESSSMNTDSVSLSIEIDYDADASSNETEFDLCNKSAIIQRNVIEHEAKTGLDLVKIANLWHEPVIRKLYYLEVYGIFYDSDSSELDFDLESETSDYESFKRSDAFWHSTPRIEKDHPYRF